MIHVNGDPKEWREGMTVRDILKLCNFKFPLLVVKVDDRLIQRADYDAFVVPDGARVAVVHLMSGG